MELSILKVNLKVSFQHFPKTLQDTAGTVTPTHITTLEQRHKKNR